MFQKHYIKMSIKSLSLQLVRSGVLCGRDCLKVGFFVKQIVFWRIGFFLLGIIILALGVTLTIRGQTFGVGSWDVLHIGLFKTVGLTIGSWSIILGIAILISIGIITKRFPKIGTWVDMVLTGVFIDIFNWLLPVATTTAIQLLAFILGLIAIGFGAGMYIAADLGVGPRDALMMLLTEYTPLSVSTARTIMEVSVALIGVMLGGPLGIGTVIMAFGLGPIVQWALKFNERLFERITGQPALQKKGVAS